MPKIYDPISIGNVEIKNRLYAPPMVSNIVREDCIAAENLIEATYMRARGGWGIYAAEGAIPNWNSKLFPRMLGNFDDNQILGLYELAEAIHGAGAKAMMQVTHAGRMADPDKMPKDIKNRECIAPSDTTPPSPFQPAIKPRGMTEEEIWEIIDDFVKSIIRAKASGWDLFNFHCSHGTLGQQFLSPFTNHRTDKWGGNWDGRLEFVRQVLTKMKGATGGSMPIVCRVAADEFVEGGYTLDEFCKYIAPALEEAGCDAFDVTCGTFEHFTCITPEMYEPRGTWINLAGAVKKVVKVPVIGLSRINDGRLAVKLIEDGVCDIVGIGRGSLADPYFAKKTIEGRYDDIRQCIACNACLEDDFTNRPSRCAVNFGYNRSAIWHEDHMAPARKPKNILVAGGGPAGMEFARVATLRGHNVTICEKNDKLGGYVPLASSYSRLYTRELMNIVRWLTRQIRQMNIKVELNTEVTQELINARKPDSVVLAIGSSETLPEIPGVGGTKVISLDEYLSGNRSVGKKVAIIGGQYGAELAVSLSREGKDKPEGYNKYHKDPAERVLAVTDADKVKEVYLLEEGPVVGMPPYSQMLRHMVLNEFLAEGGVECITGVKVSDITDGLVKYTNQEGNEESVAVDTVVLALQRIATRSLYQKLNGTGVELYEIGDCTRPENIEQAIHMANYAARQV
jgi:2,4-dienoyl-CoA reductase-like NADH-dependent reductase (Old Yellow Enzyme family)